MASVGKLALSIASGVQETTLALANFSFDFAVIKMEAPLEYRGLGNHLSKRRKLEAEEGHVHATARQLGALFADELPLVPNLQRAYGLRASEIAADSTINPTGTTADGPLASYVGLDGTSIWAAATSGRGALQVHLLACILARVWSNPEAVSIWSELVVARKAVLEERLRDDQFHMGHLMASRIEIGLEKLAEWDASARAWLGAADKAKMLQQKQLMLIIDNLGLQIRCFPRLYDSVIHVWTRAMEAMEKIVSGIAQSIETPDILLGLSAWHLYPDMAVLSDGTTHIVQKDDLIREGGLVTIGLHSTQRKIEGGISWTMPLAQMKYYGKPVLSTRSIGTKSLRVSFGDLLYIAMGSAISNWGSYGHDLESVCRFFIAFAHKCESEDPELGTSSLGWLKLFSEKSHAFLRAKDFEKREVLRLINLGRGRYKDFLGSLNDHPSPAFGLSDICTYLSLLGVEEQIKALRNLVVIYDLGFDLQEAIIFYRPERATHGEFASLFPQQLGSANASQILHRRWVPPIKQVEQGKTTLNQEAFRSLANAQSSHLFRVDNEATVLRTIEIMNATQEPCGILPGGTITDENGRMIEDLWQSSSKKQMVFLNWKYHSGSILDLAGIMKYAKGPFSDQNLKELIIGWQLGSAQHIYENVKFSYLFGSDSVMVYQPLQDSRTTAPLPLLPLAFMSSSLKLMAGKEREIKAEKEDLKKQIEVREKAFDLNKNEKLQQIRAEKEKVDRKKTEILLPYFFRKRTTGYCPKRKSTADAANYSNYLQSLANVFQASLVYDQLTSASIDPAIASTPLYKAPWAIQESKRRERTPTIAPSLPEAFSLVAAFDSGGLEINPADFEGVLAISSGGYLYVSETLLNDPASASEGIRVLVGNVGKPGMVLLLSPSEPEVMTPEADTWEMVNHHNFDGQWENNFTSTSMHLKLTGYEHHINVGRHGNRYKEVLLAEAVVSVHSRGDWVADLNILSIKKEGGYSTNWLTQRLLPQACEHSHGQKNDCSGFGQLTSIDNWPELLDRPPNTSIVRARGNWDARLALSAVMCARDDDVIIVSSEICWACVRITAAILNLDLEQLLILC